MIDVVFSESAHGSLSVAKSYQDGGYVGGCTSVIIFHDDGTEATPEEIEQAQREYEENARKRRENAIPIEIGDIFGFSQGLSYGDLNDRIGALKVLYGCWDLDLEKQVTNDLNRAAKDLERIRKKLAEGEILRVWYSQMPDEMCGFYWLMHQLRDIKDASILAVKMPQYENKDDNTIITHNGWGDIAPEDWGRFAKYTVPVLDAERRFAANKWVDLEKENAPLRAVLNGTLHSVSIDIYDRFIRREIEKQPVEFNEAMVIGNVLGRYQLGISDGFIHSRIENMVENGELRALTQPPEGQPGYHRILQKL